MKLRRVTRPELKIYILQMFEALKRKYGKKYCRPPLTTMVRLLVENPKIKTSTRTISRAIREMEDNHEIWRKNRHIRGRGIKMICRATAYYIIGNGYELFRKMLRVAQKFLSLSGKPKVAQDIVTPKRVYKDFLVLEGQQGGYAPIKGRASPEMKEYEF